MKNRNILMLLLLLVIIAAGYWFCNKEKSNNAPAFQSQGVTTVGGDNHEIRIWDYSALDGDTIDFYFDGKLIFANLPLEDSPKVYKTGPLSKGDHTIGIKSISDGMMGPASPHLSIGNGKESFEFDIDSFKDSTSGSWIIKVQ